MGTIICYNNNNIKIILQIDHTIITSDQDLTFFQCFTSLQTSHCPSRFCVRLGCHMFVCDYFQPFFYSLKVLYNSFTAVKKVLISRAFRNNVNIIETLSKYFQCTLEKFLLQKDYNVIKLYSQPISEGALSPDGSVLATASEDGYIKFWQLPDKVECMHEFQPHGGQPLSCMIFTDNQTSQDKE